MNQVIEYQTVWARTREDLELLVNEQVSLGWEPSGGMTAWIDPSGVVQLVQAIVLRAVPG